MDKEEVIRRLEECGVIAVVRADSEEQAVKICDACIKAGIVGIELTYTVPGATDVIKALAAKYSPEEMLIGAGTVLDSETARMAILAGANYIVSPYLNVEMVKLCHRYRVAVFPGAMTIKETVECMEAGADIVKVFPGSLFGPKIIKNIRGPLPYAKLMPTGGVSVENAGEWIKAGCCAVGVGGELTAGAKTGDYDKITEVGRRLIAAVREAREK